MALKENALLIKGLSWGGSVLIHSVVLATLSYWSGPQKVVLSSTPKAVPVEFLSLKTLQADLLPKKRKSRQKQKKILKQHSIQPVKEASLADEARQSPKDVENSHQQRPALEKDPTIVNTDKQKTEVSTEKQAIAILQYQGSVYDNPLPVYPFIARQRHLEGRVVLKVLVGPEGNVLNIAPLESSGYECLDQSAITAVQQWKFDTLYHHKREVVYVLVPISFRLHKTEIS
jgi:protein TonB